MNREFKFKPYIKWLLFAGLVIYAVVMIIVQQVQIKEQTALLGDLVATEEELSDRIEALESEISYMQTDEYIERTARERLGMVKENEIIFKSDDLEEDASPADPAPSDLPQDTEE